MTRDEIMRIAKECFADPDGSLVLLTPELTAFADRVTAAERERCAKLVEQYTGAWNDEGFALAAKIRKGK